MTNNTTTTDFEKAISEELPASYSDNSTELMLFAWLDRPFSELIRLNDHRHSNLSVKEFRELMILAIRLKYEMDD